MTQFLLLASGVIIACVLSNKLTNKLGMPTLLAFILLGMFLGSDGVAKIHFDNYLLTQEICTLALIFIMFYGGFGTSWKAAKPASMMPSATEQASFTVDMIRLGLRAP
ncbi:MAG: cation:proton antiporter [Ruminiclostridium sp.]|nr:cation:proton antiporter [Ruminiclostridium sp.]